MPTKMEKTREKRSLGKQEMDRNEHLKMEQPVQEVHPSIKIFITIQYFK